FNMPEVYQEVIPPYLPFPTLLNTLSGGLEILLGLLLLPHKTREYAAYGIIALLIAFIPAHLHFIQIDSCINDWCIPAWASWVRLLVIQPLIILWAWWVR
ncbi:MAG: hypothetical protein R3345_06905, partial [Fulvivirga sp.]|nr:hypothetical protein [Fulvivirga sp.]